MPSMIPALLSLSLAAAPLYAQKKPAPPRTSQPTASPFFELVALSRLHKLAVGGAEVGFYLDYRNRTDGPVSVLAYLPKDEGDYGEVRKEDGKDTVTDWQVVQPGQTLRVFVNRTLPTTYYLRATDLNGGRCWGSAGTKDFAVGGKTVAFSPADAASLGREEDGMVVCRHELMAVKVAAPVSEASARAAREGYNRAVEALNANRLDAALEAARASAQADPELAEAHYLIGFIAFQQKKDTEALPALRACLERNPPEVLAVKARAVLEQAILRAVAEAYNGAAQAFNNKNFQAACQAAHEVLALDPGFAKAHYLLGMAENQNGRAEESEKALRAYLAKEPTGQQADKAKKLLGLFLYNQAVNAFTARRFEEAYRVIHESQAMDPEFAESYYLLGGIESKRKKKVEARQAFRKYLAMAPTGAKAESARKNLKALN